MHPHKCTLRNLTKKYQDHIWQLQLQEFPGPAFFGLASGPPFDQILDQLV